MINKARSFNSFNNQHYQKAINYKTNSKRLEIMSTLIDQNQRVLDLGCGTGDFMKFLQAKKCQVEGIEISKKAAIIGKKQGLKIKISDLHHKFPYTKNNFDIITAGEIIEHIYDTDFFLEEIKRVLKPNGFLILSTPNIATLGRRLLLLFGQNPLIETSLDNSAGHIRYFTKESLEQLLNKHHFKVIHFESDTINFDNKGKFYSQFLAKLFPKLGARIIIKAQILK